MTRTIVGILAGLGLAAAPLLHAGVIDSPIPAIGDVKLKHVYTVTGVSDGDDLGTVIFCTNVDKRNVIVAVEVFTSGGGAPVNDVTTGNGALVASPGQTSTFEIPGQGIASVFEDTKIDTPVQIKSGSARILASSAKILCAAALMDKFNVAPTSMASLPVFKRGGQQGD